MEDAKKPADVDMGLGDRTADKQDIDKTKFDKSDSEETYERHKNLTIEVGMESGSFVDLLTPDLRNRFQLATALGVDMNFNPPDSDPTGTKQSKAEVKARNLFDKIGLIRVMGIKRVCIKNMKNLMFIFNEPDVYAAVGSDTYIIFGHPKVEDMGHRMQADAALQLDPALNKYKTDYEPFPSTSGEGNDSFEDDEDESETEIEEDPDPGAMDDVATVSYQANVTRKKAMKALKAYHGDVVNAIMALTV